MAKRLLFTAFILTIGTFPALAQSPDQLLKNKFVGKMLVIRNFYLDPVLHYDASGHIKGHPDKDEWTIAQFKIENVRLGSHGFELSGKRVAIGWDTKKDSVAFFNIQALTVKVEDLPSSALTESKLDELAHQIFVVLRSEPDSVPDYWRDLVSGNVVAEPDAKGHKNFRLKDHPDMSVPIGKDVAWVITHSAQGDPIYRVGGKVVPPKLLKHDDPEFSALARQLHYEGTTIMSITVNESGSPEDIQVLRPAGFGLDDNAVQVVRTWKFDPAKLDAKPVKSAVEVEVSYRWRP
ncbi:MAG: energy transducer TonB [Terriglobales bacterium]